MSEADAQRDAATAPLDTTPDVGRATTLTHAGPGSARSLDSGRLGVYSVLGAATAFVPLPWLPDLLARRIRGALVQDIARRHAVGLPREAREVLAEPSGTEGSRGFLKTARSFVTSKVLARLGPMALLAPVRASLETFVLGHLLHRYLESTRATPDRRLDVVEARRVRRAIDQALVAALTVDVARAKARDAEPSNDDRDRVTAAIDALLSRTAGVPAWLITRLEAAFEERLAYGDG